MEFLYGVLGWGSPIGIALFLFLGASGAGILFWGIAHLQASNRADKKEKEEQSGRLLERTGR